MRRFVPHDPTSRIGPFRVALQSSTASWESPFPVPGGAGDHVKGLLYNFNDTTSTTKNNIKVKTAQSYFLSLTKPAVIIEIPQAEIKIPIAVVVMLPPSAPHSFEVLIFHPRRRNETRAHRRLPNECDFYEKEFSHRLLYTSFP